MGVVFVVVLLSSLIMTAPVSAATQAFSAAPEPSDANAICAYGTQIYDFAVAKTNANVIYAATSDNALKSTNQGRTWTKVHNGPNGTDVTTSLVAIAPDDENVVAYVGPDMHVRLSMNGGTSFFDLGVPQNFTGAIVPATATLDIDISCQYTDLYGYTYRYIGVAGNDGANARFYYCAFGAYVPFQWHEATLDWAPILATDYLPNNDFFFAVKFSRLSIWTTSFTYLPRIPLSAKILSCMLLVSISPAPASWIPLSPVTSGIAAASPPVLVKAL